MLQTLIDRIRSLDDEEVFGGVVGFDRVEGTVSLRIQLFTGDVLDPIEQWKVRCAEVKEFTIRPEDGWIAAFNATHAAVRQYVDRDAEIFFVGAAADPARAAARLRAAHDQLVGAWIPFERYLNSIPAADLLGRGGGRIFAGPRFMARAFDVVLRDAGVSTYHLGEDFDEQPLATSSLEMLVVGGSHVIAAEFEAARVD